MNASAARAVLRIARRDIGRSRWRSALIVLLILLPVAAMTGAASVIKTVQPTAEQSVTRAMGRAELLVYGSEGNPSTASLRGGLPPGSEVESVLWTEGRIVLPGMQTRVTLVSLHLDGLAQGMLTVVDGRVPTAADEVAISVPVMRIANTAVGGTIELAEGGVRRVVGLVEDPFSLKATFVLQDQSVAEAAGEGGLAQWLATPPAGAEVREVPGFQLTTRAERRFEEQTVGPTIIVLGGLALVEAALVASAAFTLSIRRRQRDLGLLAATGAEPRHLAGTVVAGALLLGGLAAALGIAVGLAGALAASPFLDQLTDRRNPPVTPDVGVILVAAGIGVVAALIAALVPAWTAGRSPVHTALSGRRPAASPARRTLLAGLALVGAGIAMTGTGAVLHRSEPSVVSLLLMLAGAVVGTLGFGACSPWLLERLERPAARFPLASRIALRDTARARSRNGPLVSAVLAAFAATVALAAYQSSVDASNAAQWQPWMLPDQLMVRGDGVAVAGPDVADELGAVASAALPGVGDDGHFLWIGEPGSQDQLVYNITIRDAGLLRALAAETAIPDLEAGSVVLFSRRGMDMPRVAIHVVDADGADGQQLELPTVDVVNGVQEGDLPAAVISAGVAERLGVGPGVGDRFVVRLDHPVTQADLSRAAAIAARYPGTDVDASLGPSRPGEGFRTLILVASLLFALSVTGIAVALGEAESRPEQRTMLAVGADPRVRRLIAAARAGVISTLAGVLAVPAGLIPAWGLLVTRQAPLVIPVPEIVAALVVLPLLAVLGTFLLSRPIPTWGSLRSAGS